MRNERVAAVVVSLLLALSATTAAVPSSSVAPDGNLATVGDDVRNTSGNDATTTTTVAETTTTASTKQSGVSDRKSNPGISSALAQQLDSSATDPSTDSTGATEFVQVVVRASPGRGDEAAGLVGTNGGDVQVRHENLVQARVPTTAVQALADSPAVEFVRQPRTPDTNEITSQGLSNMDVGNVHGADVTGENVTVAVVDLGFNVTNPEIADQLVDWRNFSSPASPRTMSNQTGEHGTATAELVADTAPNASIIAVKVGTTLELYDAIDWLEANTSTDVVTMSLSWYNVGPLDGTANMNREINGSIQNGTTWFTSAGNDGYQEHWNGTWSDPDGNGLMNFSGTDEFMNVTPSGGSGSVSIAVNWNDWGGSSEDYDVYLYNDSGGVVYSSTNAQNGDDAPTEYVSGYVTEPVHLVIDNHSANGTADFDVFFRADSKPEYWTSARSVTVPGTGRNIVTVGAVHYSDNGLEHFSSRGPTIDGRIKPDVVAPDGVTTSANDPFYGTSASTPYAAGVAALMLDANESLTPADVKSRLRSSADDLYGDESNNQTGYGLVDADGAIPTVVNVSGQVDDADGNPSVDDLVYFTNETATAYPSDFTNATGEFTVSGVKAGRSYAVAYYQDYDTFAPYPHDGTPDVYALDSVTVSDYATLGQYDLPNASLLNVQVVDESGTPVENASVDFVHRNNGSTASFVDVPTDADGYAVPRATDRRGMEFAGNVTVTVRPPDSDDRFVNQLHTRDVTVQSDTNVTVALDGSTPDITAFETVVVGQDVDVRVNASEPLSNLTVDLGGDASGTLALGDFWLEEDDSTPVYRANLSDGRDGTFDASLVSAEDELGNVGTYDWNVSVVVDTTPPTFSVRAVTDAGDNAVVSDGERVSVAIDASDELTAVETVTADASALGAGSVELTDPDGDGTYRGNFTVNASGLSDGDHWLSVTVVDVRGNGDSGIFQQLLLDTHAPNTTHALAGTSNGNGWYNSSVEVNLTASDGTSSVARTEYSVNGGDWTTYDGNVTVSADGSHAVAYRSVDAAGNVETNRTVAFDVDATDPTTTLATNATVNENGWYNSSVEVDLTAADAHSGVNVTRYRVDGGDWTTYAGNFTLADGNHTVEFYSVDVAGNREANRSETIAVDATDPTVTDPPWLNRTDEVLPEHAIRVVVNATDEHSSVDEILVDGVPIGTDGSGPVSAAPALGNHTFEVVVRDAAGNEYAVSNDSTGYSVGETVEMRQQNDALAAETNDTTVEEVAIEANATDTANASVTVGTSKTNPKDTAPEDTSLYFPQINTTVPNANITNATVTITVDQSRVHRKYIEPNSVQFWVEAENESTGWQRVDARRVAETADTYTYEVEAPHFSTYAVTGEKESAPPNVTAFDTADESLTPGDVTLSASYTDGYSGIDAANVTLQFEGSDVTSEATVTDSELTLTRNLSAGTYDATLTLNDNAGNPLDSPETLTFTVAAETDESGTSSGDSGGGGGGGGGGANVPPPAVGVTMLETTDDSFRAKISSVRADAPGYVSTGGIAASDVTVEQVVVTPESEDALARFFVSGSVTASAPDGASTPDVTTLGHLRVATTYLSDAAIDSLGVRFAVPADAAVAPENVALYRFDGGSWQQVETTVVRERGGRYVLRASASATGTFAVGVTGGDLSVTDASVGANRVASGETVAVTATVENAGDGTGATTAELEVDGEVVATKQVTLADGESTTVTFEVTLDAPGRHDLAVDGASAGSVTVSGETTATPSAGDGDADETTRPTQTTTADEESRNGGGVPGFGVSAALVALLAALLVVRGRA